MLFASDTVFLMTMCRIEAGTFLLPSHRLFRSCRPQHFSAERSAALLVGLEAAEGGRWLVRPTVGRLHAGNAAWQGVFSPGRSSVVDAKVPPEVLRTPLRYEESVVFIGREVAVYRNLVVS